QMQLVALAAELDLELAKPGGRKPRAPAEHPARLHRDLAAVERDAAAGLEPDLVAFLQGLQKAEQLLADPPVGLAPANADCLAPPGTARPGARLGRRAERALPGGLVLPLPELGEADRPRQSGIDLGREQVEVAAPALQQRGDLAAPGRGVESLDR